MGSFLSLEPNWSDVSVILDTEVGGVTGAVRAWRGALGQGTQNPCHRCRLGVAR